jgi:hypothetical protein
MKKDANFYRKLFGSVPPEELTKPINELELFAQARRDRAKCGWEMVPYRDALEEERERRSAVLREFLNCKTETEVLDSLKQLLFRGFETASSRHPRAVQTEIRQFAALLSLGVNEQNAAQIIAKRQDNIGLDGQVRKWQTIKRDFQATAVKKGWGEYTDPAQIALLSSGLLDPLEAAAKQHPITVIYFPETDAQGIQYEFGSLQASIAMAATMENAVSDAVPGRTLPDDMKKSLWDHFEASKPPHPSATASESEWDEWKVAYRASGYPAAVIVPQGSNSGPIFRDILLDLGLDDVPLIEATGPLSDITRPAIVLFKNDIPMSMRGRVNNHLGNVTKASHKLVERAQMSAHKAQG